LISTAYFCTLGEADSAVHWAFEVFIPFQRPPALRQTNICHVLFIFISRTYPWCRRGALNRRRTQIWSPDPSEKPSLPLRKRQDRVSRETVRPKKRAIRQWEGLRSRKMGLSHGTSLSHKIRAIGIIVLVFQRQVPGYDQTPKRELPIGSA
jgi:hypothetical protein